jgi:hypothetical protein
MALLDYFFGYYQIWLHKEDEEKTSSLHLSAPIAILGCLKVSRMLAQHSIE